MSKKERYVPLNDQKVIVSLYVYQAYYRIIWNTYKRERRHSRCTEPNWRHCKGDCFICPSHCGTEFDPLPESDYFSYNIGTTVEDVADIIIRKEMFETMFHLADTFDPKGKYIFQLIAAGVTDREAAKIFLTSQSTFNRRKNELLNKVRASLQK